MAIPIELTGKILHETTNGLLFFYQTAQSMWSFSHSCSCGEKEKWKCTL